MEDEIARVLEASISPDEATRVNAEQHLTQGGTMPGFGLALVRCALNRQVPPGTRQLAAVVLSEDENYVQALLLREAAVALDATVRDSLRKQIVSPLQALPRPPLPPLPAPLSPLLAPLTLPFDLAEAVAELGELDDTDAKRLENVAILTDLARGFTTTTTTAGGGGAGSGAAGGGGGGGLPIGSLAREAAARRLALARIGVRFGGSLAATQAERLRQRSEQHEQEQQQASSPLAGRLAKEGAQRLERIAGAIKAIDEGLAAGKASEAVETATARLLADGSARLAPGRAERK